MKRFLFLSALLTTASFAQDKNVYVVRGHFGALANMYKTWHFVPDQDASFPSQVMEPLKARFDPGIGGEFSFGYMYRSDLLISYLYGSYQAKDPAADEELSHSMNLALGQYYFSQGNLRPFAQAGAGMTHMEMKYVDLRSVETRDINRWYPVIALGGGLEYSLSEETVFNLQMTGHFLFGSKSFKLGGDSGFRSAWLGSAAGLSKYRLHENLNFFTVSAGIVFKIGF